MDIDLLLSNGQTSTITGANEETLAQITEVLQRGAGVVPYGDDLISGAHIVRVKVHRGTRDLFHGGSHS